MESIDGLTKNPSATCVPLSLTSFKCYTMAYASTGTLSLMEFQNKRPSLDTPAEENLARIYSEVFPNRMDFSGSSIVLGSPVWLFIGGL